MDKLKFTTEVVLDDKVSNRLGAIGNAIKGLGREVGHVQRGVRQVQAGIKGMNDAAGRVATTAKHLNTAASAMEKTANRARGMGGILEHSVIPQWDTLIRRVAQYETRVRQAAFATSVLSQNMGGGGRGRGGRGGGAGGGGTGGFLSRGLSSYVLMGAGEQILSGIGGLMHPAMEYAHQLNIMEMTALRHEGTVRAVAAAWKEAGSNLTTNVTGNLKSILDLTNVLGDISGREAIMMLPVVNKVQTLLGASTESGVANNAQDFTFSLAKTAESMGFAQDPSEFKSFMTGAARVIMATQGRVTAQQMQQVIAYSGVERFLLRNETGRKFFEEYFPALMLERSLSKGGGGSRNLGPMLGQFERAVMGNVSKKAMGIMGAFGLVDTSGGKPMLINSGMVNDPYHWTLAAFDQIMKHWGDKGVAPIVKGLDPRKASDLALVLSKIFDINKNASSFLVEMVMNSAQIERDHRLITQSMDLESAYMQSMFKDPKTAIKALSDQWETMLTAFTMNTTPTALSGMHALADAMSGITGFMLKHPDATKVLAETVIGVGAVVGALAVAGGFVFLFGGALTALGLTFPPVLAALAAMAALIAIYHGATKEEPLPKNGMAPQYYMPQKRFLHSDGSPMSTAEIIASVKAERGGDDKQVMLTESPASEIVSRYLKNTLSGGQIGVSHVDASQVPPPRGAGFHR